MERDTGLADEIVDDLFDMPDVSQMEEQYVRFPERSGSKQQTDGRRIHKQSRNCGGTWECR